MRSTWKEFSYSLFHSLPALGTTPWSDQRNEYVGLYNGKNWRLTRCRVYFTNKKYRFFVATVPTSRLIRAKFANLRKKKKKK